MKHKLFLATFCLRLQLRQWLLRDRSSLAGARVSLWRDARRVSSVNVAQVHLANGITDDDTKNKRNIKRLSEQQCKTNTITHHTNSNDGWVHFWLVEDYFHHQSETRLFVAQVQMILKCWDQYYIFTRLVLQFNMLIYNRNQSLGIDDGG